MKFVCPEIRIDVRLSVSVSVCPCCPDALSKCKWHAAKKSRPVAGKKIVVISN